MLRDLFDKGKCTLGFHVEAWRYAYEGSCQQTSMCPRCQAVSQRVVHEWPDSWQFVAPDDCRMARACRRCQEQETKVEHEWGTPQYRADESCDQVRLCDRCGASTPAGTTHVWNAWAYTTDERCEQTLACARCQTRGTVTRTGHDWREWQQSRFYEARVRVCGRCAEMVFDLDEADDEGKPMSMQRVAGSVAEVAAATDAAGLRERIIARKRELLSPVANRYFRFALESSAGDASMQKSIATLIGLLERCRIDGIDATIPIVSPPLVPPPLPNAIRTDRVDAPAVDMRLAGHWRHTESLSSGGVSLVTDTHLVLERSGRFEWWSKSAGSMGTSTAAAEPGSWSAINGSIHLLFDAGHTYNVRFIVSGDSMMCPDEGRYRLWQRIE